MESAGIWALIETEAEKVDSITFELLSEGRKLADKIKGEFAAIAFGSNVRKLIENSIEELSLYGLDKIYIVEDDALKEFDSKVYADIFSELVKIYNPQVVLCSATSLGNELACRVAAKLKTGLVTDCTLLETDTKGQLKATKPIHEDKLTGIYTFSSKFPQMATFRPGLIDPDPAKESVKPEIVQPEIEISTNVFSAKFIEFFKGDPKTIDLGEADVIVAGGKGLDSKDGVTILEQLAYLIRGSTAGSRVAVDKGWLPLERQIGQTGKRVSPQLFVAMGISGAIQFQMGMKDSKKVISINTQKNAPIFKISDLKVVGDLHQIVPEAIKQIKALNEINASP
ncbi:MAG: electron transfer flavoprotein subunit alpha/FixB family protein [Pseudomonadota bacterium]